jgi:putative acetyltransferase
MELTIRRAEPTDYEAIARHLGDPRVFPGTLQVPHPSVDGWRRRLAENGDAHYVLMAHDAERFAGLVGLHPAGATPRRSHVMSLGITVAGEWQGKGVGRRLMTEILRVADDWLNIFRIELNVFSDNARAIALYRRFGFEIEGTHRAYALRDGRYCDCHSMARIKPKPPAV